MVRLFRGRGRADCDDLRRQRGQSYRVDRGRRGDNRLHGYRADTGEELTKATGETMQGLRHFVTILAAEGNLYVAADERIYAFAF